MNVPIRVRLTFLYFLVLTATFVAFFWVSDLGFQRSIEVTVNDASRSNLQSLQQVLQRTVAKGDVEVRDELTEVAELWANNAIFEVADARGNWVFRAPAFSKPAEPLPSVGVGPVIFFTTNLNWQQYRVALQKVTVAGQGFEVHAAVPTEPFDQALDHFRLIEKEILPILVLVASLLGYWLSGKSLAPVNRVIETAQLIGVQNLSRRLEVPRAHDEIRRLTETLNAMLGRIEVAFKKTTQLTADASHDLRTPLAVIRASAEITLRRPRSSAEYCDSLHKILKTSVETSELLENLLTLARADAGVAGMELHPLNLAESIRKSYERGVVLGEEKSLRFTVACPTEPVWVRGDSVAIDRLLLILVDNAVKYTPAGGACHISLSQSDDSACLEVSDTGLGVCESDLQSIFERFVRADPARNRLTGGAGLGLAIARWIVEMHGGHITAQSMLGAGSTFRVELPLFEMPVHSAVHDEKLATQAR